MQNLGRPTGPGDAASVAAIGRGDEAAFREVISTHGPAVLALATRVAANRAVAEEVAQDTFVALWRKADAFDAGRGSLRAFLLGIARKKAIDAVRKEEVRTRAAAGMGRDGTSDDETARVDLSTDLTRSLGRLPDKQRQAIALAYLGGLSYREVAVRLGVPEGTIKTRMRDGMTRLRTIVPPLSA